MTLPAAGWYPDPDNAAHSRWWNGVSWTENRSDFVAPMPPVNPGNYSMTATTLTAPEGTQWNTVWIWLVVVLPYIPSLGLLFIDWPSMFTLSAMSSRTSSMSLLASPAYLFSSLGGFVAYGLSVWFAYCDYRELGRRGVPRPFHWAWAFISYAVYPIGRSVVVRRRIGRGISPMWAAITLMALSFVLGIVFAVYLISMVFAQMPSVPGYGA